MPLQTQFNNLDAFLSLVLAQVKVVFIQPRCSQENIKIFYCISYSILTYVCGQIKPDPPGHDPFHT
jgi:hypothetical protein